MSATVLSVVISACLFASSTSTQAAGCSPGLNDQIVSAERIIDSLRPEKNGQSRVFASDGSEYTAGQALWIKAQMRAVLRACMQGDEAAATVQLQGVLDLLKQRHRAP